MKNKIKSLLSLYGYNLTQYAEKLGIFKQSLTRKISTNSLRVEDLVDLADLTGTTLAFVDDKGDTVMKFDKTDF